MLTICDTLDFIAGDSGSNFGNVFRPLLVKMCPRTVSVVKQLDVRISPRVRLQTVRGGGVLMLKSLTMVPGAF